MHGVGVLSIIIVLIALTDFVNLIGEGNLPAIVEIMKYIIIVGLFGLIVSGCISDRKKNIVTKESEIEKSKVINIEIKEGYKNEILYDSIFKHIQIIPLETNRECLITEVNKVIIYDSLLYIQNGRNNILVFNLLGNHINTIGKKGKGPGEILSLRDFCIYKNCIHILDFSCIKKYTMNGDFIKNFKFDFSPEENITCNPMQFEVSNNFIYLWGGTFSIKNNDKNNLFALYKLDENFDVVDRYLRLTHKLPENMHRFSNYNNTISVSPPFGNDTLYEIDNNLMKAKYYVDFKNKRLKEKVPEEFASFSNWKSQMDVKYSHSIENVMQVDKWLHFTFKHNRYTYNVFYSKEKGCSYVSQFYPRHKERLVPYKIDGVFNDKFIALMPVHTLIDDLKRLSIQEETEYLNNSKYLTIKEEDNPVLYICNMK